MIFSGENCKIPSAFVNKGKVYPFFQNSRALFTGVIDVTEKDLKKLNRYQLLEMLIMQTERADELQRKLEEAQAKLESRDIQMQNIGSIAEASLQLSGIFEAAQSAADLYLNSVKERVTALEAEYVLRAESVLADAKETAQQILREAGNDQG